jgi:hypothetical protein
MFDWRSLSTPVAVLAIGLGYLGVYRATHPTVIQAIDYRVDTGGPGVWRCACSDGTSCAFEAPVVLPEMQSTDHALDGWVYVYPKVANSGDKPFRVRCESGATADVHFTPDPPPPLRARQRYRL